MERKAQGLTFYSHDRLLMFHHTTTAFVNNANGMTNIPTYEPSSNLIRLLAQTRHDAQLWYDLLCATRGDLELAKCFHYILYWMFDESAGEPGMAPRDETRYPALCSSAKPTQHAIFASSSLTQTKSTKPFKL